MGGDRDGHPFVTPEISKETLVNNKRQIISLYQRDLDILYSQISSSNNIISVSKELEKSVALESSLFNLDIKDTVLRDPSEIYRSKILLISLKLEETKQNSAHGYRNMYEFLDDLYLIYNSLSANKGKIIGDVNLLPYIYKVETFGFRFAALDIRQNAFQIRDAINEIFNFTEVCRNYNLIDEESKIKILTDEILKARPLKNNYSKLSDTTFRIIEEFGVIKWGKENVAPNACNDYIISNCASVSDILTALLLAKEAGLITVAQGRIFDTQIDILPLFETIFDLRESDSVMKELFDNKAYSQHLKIGNNIQ